MIKPHYPNLLATIVIQFALAFLFREVGVDAFLRLLLGALAGIPLALAFPFLQPRANS